MMTEKRFALLFLGLAVVSLIISIAVWRKTTSQEDRLRSYEVILERVTKNMIEEDENLKGAIKLVGELSRSEHNVMLKRTNTLLKLTQNLFELTKLEGETGVEAERQVMFQQTYELFKQTKEQFELMPY